MLTSPQNDAGIKTQQNDIYWKASIPVNASKAV